MAKPDAVFIYIGTYPKRAGGASRLRRRGRTCMRSVRSAPTTPPRSPRTTRARCTSTRMRWPPGTARGAAPPSARSSASCLCSRSSPPPSVGAAVGGVGGHLWRGMSRADVKELGDIIDDRQAALVIVGESRVGAGGGQGRAEGREARRQGTRRQARRTSTRPSGKPPPKSPDPPGPGLAMLLAGHAGTRHPAVRMRVAYRPLRWQPGSHGQRSVST